MISAQSFSCMDFRINRFAYTLRPTATKSRNKNVVKTMSIIRPRRLYLRLGSIRSIVDGGRPLGLDLSRRTSLT